MYLPSFPLFLGLSTMEILTILSRYAAKRDIKFVLIGGHALNLYGVSRQTGDIDILVCERDRLSWKEILLELGYRLYQEHPSFMQFSPPAIDSWPVDLMFVEERTFNGLLENGRVFDIDGVQTTVPCVEHLIALEIHVLKQGQAHRKLKDLDDIVTLIEGPGIDPHGIDLKKLCDLYGSEEIHERIVRIIESRRDD